MNIYKSFEGLQSKKEPAYPCEELISDGYRLKVAIHKNNPDLKRYIEEKEKNGFVTKLIELKSKQGKKSIIDVWVKNTITIREREFYRAEDLAELLQVNIMTIYRYIKASRIKAYKIGREYRIDNTEFQAFLKKVSTKK